MGSTARDLVFEILAIDGASHIFDKIGRTAQETSAKVEESGSAWSKLGVTGTAAIAGVAAGAALLGAKTIQMAANFQQGLTRLVTSAGESQANLRLVGDGIKQIAVDTGTSTKQLVDGMYMIESAGFHGANGLKILKAAAEGAKAENADLGTVSNALTTVMKDYNLTADHSIPVMNQLIATVSHGKTTMQDLAGALHSVLPIAASAKLSYAEVGGAIATMTSHGVSAELATQHLANLIRNLQSPTSEAAQEMGRFGLSAIDVQSHLGQRGLTGTLNMLFTAITSHMGPAGTVLMNAFNSSRDAAASAQKMISSMPSSLQNLAREFQNGNITTAQWRAQLKGLPVDQQNIAKQFAATVNQSRGFSTALKENKGASETLSAALKNMTGGAVGLESALQLTGANATDFTNNVNAISDASHHAGKNVENWHLIQHQFNQKLSESKEVVETTGISIGQKLLPVATAMLGVFRSGTSIIGGIVGWLTKHKEIAEGLGIAIAVALLPPLWGLVTATAAAVAGFIAANIATGGILIAVGLLAAGIIWLVTHWRQAWKAISDIAKEAWHYFEEVYIRPYIIAFKALYQYLWTDFGAKIMAFLTKTIPEWGRTGYRLFYDIYINPYVIAFKALYNYVWSDFGQKIYNFLVNTLPGWFRSGVDNVKKAFGGFANAVLVPVNWVIRYVWNDGIEAVWNDVAGVFGGPKLSPFSQLSVPNFAAGGAVPAEPGMFSRPTAIVGEGNPAWPEYVIPTDPKYRDRSQALWAAAGQQMQMMAGGGLLGGVFGSIWHGITDVAGSVVGALKNLALGGLRAAANTAFGVLNDILGHIPGAGTEIGQQLIAGVKTGEQDILSFLGKKDATAVSKGPATSAQVLAWIQAAMALTGVSGANWINGLETIIHYESGGNPSAINLSDSNAAAGDPSRGLMQTIGSTFSAYHQAGTSWNIYDPIANIAAGINYINARYGGIGSVPGIVSLAGGGSYVGYQNGGIISAGSIGLVGEHGPELVAGGRSGVSVAPIGGGGQFEAVVDLRIDGQTIDRQLVKFQRVGGTLQSAQTEIRRFATTAGTLSR